MDDKQQAVVSNALVVTDATVEEKPVDSSLSITLLFDQLEQLLASTEQGAILQSKIVSALEELEPLLNSPDVKIPEKGKVLLNKANHFIQKRPLVTLGVAAGASILLTLLANFRK